jgi:hypothetical protein
LLALPKAVILDTTEEVKELESAFISTEVAAQLGWNFEHFAREVLECCSERYFFEEHVENYLDGLLDAFHYAKLPAGAVGEFCDAVRLFSAKIVNKIEALGGFIKHGEFPYFIEFLDEGDAVYYFIEEH